MDASAGTRRNIQCTCSVQVGASQRSLAAASAVKNGRTASVNRFVVNAGIASAPTLKRSAMEMTFGSHQGSSRRGSKSGPVEVAT